MEPRIPQTRYQERLHIPFAHAQATADVAAAWLWQAPGTTSRLWRVNGVKYNNPTGLAAGAAGFDVQILKGAAGPIVAHWNTVTGQQGALVADTPVDLVLSATDANLIIPGGTSLYLLLDETGDSTLPAGLGHIEVLLVR